MKTKYLSVATAGSMLLAGAASAAYTGTEIYSFDTFYDAHPNGAIQGAWAAQAGALDVYRVYAEFDSADTVGATFGAGAVGQLMFLTNKDSGNFFNYTKQTYYGNIEVFNTAPSAGEFGVDGTSGFDTFATIGKFVNDGETTLTAGVAGGTNDFASNWDSDSFTGGTGGWFSFDPLAAQTQANLGSAEQGFGDDGVHRVMLFQIAVPAGEGIEGNFGIQTGSEGNVWEAGPDGRTFFTTNAPAPGALALLGIAGLAGGRRRRK